jgi:hypothetical protein
MGVPAEMIARAHDRGIIWMQTVGDAAAAEPRSTASILSDRLAGW